MSFDQLTTNYINTPESSVSYWDICDLIDWNEGGNRWSIGAVYAKGQVIGRDYNEYPSYTSTGNLYGGPFDPSAHFLPRNVLIDQTTEIPDQWNKSTGKFTIKVSGIYDISWRFRYGSDTVDHRIRLNIENESGSLVSRYTIFEGTSQYDDVLVGSKNIYLEKNYKFYFNWNSILWAEGSSTLKILFNSRDISCSGFTVVRYRY